METPPRDRSVTRRMTLTATAIEAMAPGDVLQDDRVPGLSVRCNAASRSFMLYYRTRRGDQRRPKVGEYGAISIAQAREIARQWLAQVAAGGDPSGQHQTERRDPDMNDLWARCEREHWNRGRQWDRDARRLYAANARPALGTKRVRDIGYGDLSRLHAAMADTPIEANRTLSVLAKMLRLAELWEYRPRGSNPSRDVKRYSERKRKRFARPLEVAAIGPVLDRYARDPRHVSGVAFLHLLIFSGARPSEIERGTPDMIERVVRDGQVYGVLRLEKGKTGERNVFLPPQAMAVIDKLPAGRERLADRKTMPKRLWSLIREEVGAPDLWARDWRRTFATNAMWGGMSIEQVGELLGHQSIQTTKIYAALMEDPAFQAAGQVASRMEAMLASRPEQQSAAKVAPDGAGLTHAAGG